MNKEDYFRELSRVLKEEGLKVGTQEEERLRVLSDDNKTACYIGLYDVYMPLECTKSNEMEVIYHKVAEISSIVREYVGVLETAPKLDNEGVKTDYRVIADYNDIVLCGLVHNDGLGYQFSTWLKTQDKQGVCIGNYFSDDYVKAKENFAVRSGLIDENKYFNNEELIEITRCVSDTLDGESEYNSIKEKIGTKAMQSKVYFIHIKGMALIIELTEDTVIMLENIKEKIEIAIPDIEEIIANLKEDFYNEQSI